METPPRQQRLPSPPVLVRQRRPRLVIPPRMPLVFPDSEPETDSEPTTPPPTKRRRGLLTP